MGPVNGCLIRSTTLEGRFDSVTVCNTSDAGFGVVTFVEGLPAASSTVVAALLVRGPALLGLRAVLRRLRHAYLAIGAMGSVAVSSPICDQLGT